MAEEIKQTPENDEDKDPIEEEEVLRERLNTLFANSAQYFRAENLREVQCLDIFKEIWRNMQNGKINIQDLEDNLNEFTKWYLQK